MDGTCKILSRINPLLGKNFEEKPAKQYTLFLSCDHYQHVLFYVLHKDFYFVIKSHRV